MEFNSIGFDLAFELYGHDYVVENFPLLIDKFIPTKFKNEVLLSLMNEDVSFDGGELFMELVKAKNVDVLELKKNKFPDLKQYNSLFFILRSNDVDDLINLSNSIELNDVFWAYNGKGNKLIMIGIKY